MPSASVESPICSCQRETGAIKTCLLPGDLDTSRYNPGKNASGAAPSDLENALDVLASSRPRPPNYQTNPVRLNPDQIRRPFLQSEPKQGLPFALNTNSENDLTLRFVAVPVGSFSPAQNIPQFCH